MLDVRLPIGALFFILGIMIGAWGYTHPAVPSLATKMGPMPINFDIIWGILMTIFGVAMFSLAKLDQAVTMERQLKEEQAKASGLELAAAIASAPEVAPAAASSVSASPEAGGASAGQGQAPVQAPVEKPQENEGTTDGAGT